MKYWLMKSEPNTFSIDDLETMKNQTEHWDGIRNYQARNYMRDDMRIGDKAFFYHSNCDVIGIVGIMEIVRESYPDFTAFDSMSNYFDPKSKIETPRWMMVDVKFVEKFKRTISLNELKEYPQLKDMLVIKRGQRLSIQPVQKNEWDFIIGLLKP
jgi:predicted RNA-binding protein with PUA-like domain